MSDAGTDVRGAATHASVGIVESMAMGSGTMAACVTGRAWRSCDVHAIRHVDFPEPCIGHGPGACEPAGQHLDAAALRSCDALAGCRQHAATGAINNAPTWSTANVSAHTRERRSAFVMDGRSYCGGELRRAQALTRSV